MPTYTQENSPVWIETPFGANVLLVKGLTGAERMGQAFQYELVLASEEHELDYKKIIGQNVTVFVDKPGGEPRYFNGFISRFAQTKYERKLAEYHATLVPWLWFLTRSSDCRIFQALTIPEIIKQVFTDHGFADVIDRLQGTYRKWDYCVQYRETCYDFVNRLMEEEGIYYYFKHEQGKHSLVLCDSSASHKQFVGYEELLYRPSAATVQLQETLRTWAVQNEVQSGAYATTDFDFTTPRRGTLANSARDRNHSQSQLEQFDYLGEQSPFSEGERYSKLRLEEQQAWHETYTGEGNARGVCNGVRFLLKGHPRQDFNQEYLVTNCEIEVRANPLETTEAQGDEFKFNARLSAILQEEQYRSPRVTPKPIVHGPQTAVVVGPGGQKIYTDQYGRVKVQFHWDRRGSNDQDSSCWIRVSQSWAGKPQAATWGDMALPHVGDEVIVECLEGDPDRPIITGRVYNQANMPPLTLPVHKDKRIWQDDFGNQLIFDATPGDEHIRLYSPHHNSGITLGRSACDFTESNSNKVTLGTAVATAIGPSVQAYAGLCAGFYGGVYFTGVVGSQYNLTVGSNTVYTFGPTFQASHGVTYMTHDTNHYQIAKENTIISSGQSTNLVGGSGASGTSYLHAAWDHLELSAGAPQKVEDAALPAKRKAIDIALMVIPVLSSGVLAGASAYAGTFNSQTPANPDADSLAKQKDFEIVAGLLMAGGLVANIVAQKLYSSSLTQTKPALHKASDSKARIRLQNSGSALLESKLAMDLWANNREANIHLDSKITIQNSSGDIVIQSGTTAVTIANSGDITIAGSNVKVTGNFDVSGGALSVMGSPVPVLSAMAALVAEQQAADAAEAAKNLALIAELEGMAAASMV